MAAYPEYIDNGGVFTDIDADVTVDCPATVDANDILVAIVFDKDNDTFTDTTTGWILGGQTNNAGLSFCYFYRVADGTEDGTSVTFTSSSSSGTLIAGVINRFKYNNAGVALFDFISLTGSGPGTSVSVPAATSSGSFRTVFNFICVDTNTSCSDATDYTQEYEIGAAGYLFHCQSQELRYATTTTARTSTLGTSSYYGSITITFRTRGWYHKFIGVHPDNVDRINGELITEIASVGTIE